MAMITVTWATGINSSAPPPGYQLNMALGVLALVVAVLGSGRFSLDAVIERRIGATEVLATADRQPRRPAASQTSAATGDIRPLQS